MIIPIKSIKIERINEASKRVRKDFGSMEELIESIKKLGLIHPIVVDKTRDDLGHEYLLIAGERRLTAALYLGWREIDASIRSDLSLIKRKEIELEENARRKDLSWQEQIEALRQLDQLKRKIEGTRQPGEVSKAGWTIHDTAKTVGASLGTVSQDIALAEALVRDEELRKKVSGMGKVEARKFVERTKTARRMMRAVERKEIVLDTSLILGRAEEEIKRLEDNSIHLLLTDPPFAVQAITDVSHSSLTEGSYYDQGTNVGEEEEFAEIYKILIPELSRVMIPGAHFYLFHGVDWRDRLVRWFRENSFIVHPVPLVWYKGRGTMIPNPYHYVPSYENILFGARSPQRRTLLKPMNNCLTGYPTMASQKRTHPLQKPKELLKMFIENSTVPGETVLDCFAGSGATLKAAREIGRKGIGFECDEANFYAAQKFLGE